MSYMKRIDAAGLTVEIVAAYMATNPDKTFDEAVIRLQRDNADKKAEGDIIKE